MERTIRIPAGEHHQPILCPFSESTKLTIHVESNASVDLLCLFSSKNEENIEIHQQCTVEQGAILHVCNISLGGKNFIQNLVSRIEGEGGESTIDWIFYGKDYEKQTLSARNIFDAPNGRGEITVHGVAEGHAESRFTGFIEITKNGGGTNTYLTEKTLMLDPTAKVNAVPGLEIKTNDVKASHSASVSKVSEEDLFYFASRGIGKSIARRMYIEGFLGALVERIPDESLREKILAEIAKKYQKER
ncbi:MAG TPA: SufD family Fe-S cluster assembly protein [Candidatus Peribacterales bacterium]|nr:SufD family Fe-S cluster assembly protein [Candidatus Peribacterales bacterium]